MTKDLKDLERSMIDINEIDSFFKKTGMREGQKDSVDQRYSKIGNNLKMKKIFFMLNLEELHQ